MPLQQIERIALPDDDTFWKDYVLQRRPVIITNLFEGQEIREVQSLAEARAAFGGIRLSVRPEAVRAAGAVQPEQSRVMNFNEYWDLVGEHPDTDLICSEQEIPARVMALFEFPGLCQSRNSGADEVLSLPRRYGQHDLLSQVFVANRGNRAHLHYDGDHRQVLLYQVFGRKRVFLFDPQDGNSLRPSESLVGYSGVSLENMTEADKLERVDAGNGYAAMLQPGEAIFMPMLIWHYLEYTDHAMSLNVRFGRNRYGRFLCGDSFHRDYFIQTFASRLADEAACESTFADPLRAIAEEYVRPRVLSEKVRAMRRIFRGLCADLISQGWTDVVCPEANEQREIEKILADIGHRMCYAEPAVIACARPTGKGTPAQSRQLMDTARARHYDSEKAFERLLWNRVGKRNVESLNQAEIAQLLTYMRSPGATWQ